METDQIINLVYPLPPVALSKLLHIAEEQTYARGHILFKEGKVEEAIYLIKRGIVRAFAQLDEQEVTFWFGKEGDAAISMNSYVAEEKGYESIELLEDCNLVKIPSEALHRFFGEDIHIANWGRRFAEKELVKTEERLISRQFKTATERYKELLQQSPDLLQRVQLGHIASYLGVTQVSLSRIRSGIR